MFRDVLVVVDATSDAREALSQAIDLAQREHSRRARRAYPLTFIRSGRVTWGASG